MNPDFDTADIDCENVLNCLYNLTEVDEEILDALEQSGEFRSDDLAEKIGKDQSTVYRSLQRLHECGLIYKEKEKIRNGGYFFLYSIRPVDKIREEAKECIEDWYKEMKGTIEQLDEV